MSTMQVETLDLLTAKGRFDPAAARAIGEAINLETRKSSASLATKQDLLELRALTKDDINELKVEAAELRTELKVEAAELRTELKAEAAELRTELKAEAAELRTELKAEAAELRTELKVELQSTKAELVRWILLTMMAQSAMLIGAMYFLLQHTAR